MSDELPRDHRGHFKKRAIPAAVRRSVASRYGCAPGGTADAHCHYCGFKGGIMWFRYSRGLGWPAFGSLELDHVEPEVRGGATKAENIVLACRPCNRGKGSRTVEEWGGQ